MAKTNEEKIIAMIDSVKRREQGTTALSNAEKFLQESREKKARRLAELEPLKLAREKRATQNTTTPVIENDSNVIAEYESMDNHNLIERIKDSSKAEAYEKKQSMLSDYKNAKKSQYETALNNNNIDIETIEHALGNIISADSEQGMAELQQKHKDALAQLEKAGLSYEDAEDYYYNYYQNKEFQNNSAVKAKENPVSESLHSLFYNALGGITGTADSLYSYATGKPIDSDSGNYALTKRTNDIRTTVSSDLEPLAKLAYDVGMNLGDTATASLFALGNTTGAGALRGTQAFSNSVIDGAERKLTPDQIMGTAVINGAIEGAMEKIPLDSLKGLKPSGGVLKQLLKQSVKEGTTEMATELGTTVTDNLINQNKSNYELRKAQLVQEGMTEEEAQKQVLSEIGSQIGYSGVVGALSGGAMSGGAMLANGNQNVQTTNNVQEQADLAKLEPLANLPQTEKQTSNESNTNVQAPLKKDVLLSQNLEPLVDTSMSYGKDNMDSVNGDKSVINVDSEHHTPEQLRTIEEYQKSNNAQISTWADRKRKGQKSFKYLPVATVNDFVADLVQEKYKIDIHSNSVGLNESSLRHIDNEHTNNPSKSQMSNEDLERIGYVLENPDDIVLTEETTTATRTKDNQFAPKIILRKRVDGHYYIVEAVTDANTNQDVIVTAFIEEVGKESQKYLELFKGAYHVPNALEKSSPLANVQNVHENSSFDNNIPNSSETVNDSSLKKRSYNDTLIEKTDAPQELKNEFISTPDMYSQLSNAETSAKANEIMANNDVNTAMTQFRQLLDAKDPVAVPLGYNLSKQLTNSGRIDDAVQIVRDMSQKLTEAGQFSQAAAITMLNENPEAAKRYLIREIDNMNKKGREKFGKKWNDFQLTEAELQNLSSLEVGDTEGIQKAYDDVYNRIRKEYPATMKEKLLELRRVSMLLNTRTNVRNVVSNALLFPVRWSADRVTALGEGAYKLIKDPTYERTQSLNPIRSKQSKQIASEVFKNVKSELLGDNKYEDVKGSIRDKQVFKGSKLANALDNVTNGAITKANEAMGKVNDPSLLETARNFTYFLLQKGDDAFVKANFESRLASYLDAQGITDIADVPADAITLATQEAMKATFKDDSSFSKMLSSIKQNTGMFGEIILPFTKTPANLAMRGIDYSPIGVANAIKKLKNAQSTQEINSAMTSLGQGVTGTAAIALGYVLAQSGLISGALSEDKDEAQFQKQQGMLPYAININGNYYSYDWAQPASIPIILGATIYQANQDSDKALNTIYQGATAAVNSWLELSPLQNVSDLFGGYGTPAENAIDMVLDLPTSFIPAQLGAAAKVADTTQRVTYDNTSRINRLINSAKSKIPGLSETLPVAYDTWGNPIQRQDSTGEAAFANLINPGQFGNENVTAIDPEITRLYESTGSNTVFPKKASWSYKVSGENVKLNNEQYSEYQRIMGENSFDMVSSLMESTSYDSLDDEQRTGAISNMYSFADALAKKDVLGYDLAASTTYGKAYAIYKERGAEGVATFYAIKQKVDGTGAKSYMSALRDMDLSNEDKGYYLNSLLGSGVSKVGSSIYQNKGSKWFYDYYNVYTSADTDNNGSLSNAEFEQALMKSELPTLEQVYLYSAYKGK